MRKVLTAAAVTAGALLMTTAGTASALDPWEASVPGASAKGGWTGLGKDKYGNDSYRADGKLTVTDPEACYHVQGRGTSFIAKPRPFIFKGTSSARQCGPGTIDVTSTVMSGWDLSVKICTDLDNCDYGAFTQLTVPAGVRTGVSAVSAGRDFSVALKNGKVTAWGVKAEGRTSVPAEAASGVTAIDAGESHALAVRDGKVLAWGAKADGRTTVPADAKSGVTAVAAGGRHSLALKGGKVIAWGQDGKGKATVPAEAKSGVTAIAAAGGVSAALKGGKVLIWGTPPT
ncbi:hypothetical protein ACFQ2B_36710 [Streptomyces stramineus]